MSFLTVEGLAKSYGAASAVDDVSFTLAAGSRMAVVGPSGSGKTTLLRLIAGFEAPDRGRIVLDGEVLAEGGRAVPAHRRGIGVVMQDGALFPHLSVAENIGFGLPRRMAGRAARIEHLLEMTGLDPTMGGRAPDTLSGGQQQRVALARALARSPRLMLLDEPFSALDTALRESTRQAVSDLLAASGIATILVTHDQTEALSFADQVGVMGQGRLLQIGTPQALYRRPATPAVAAMLGEAIVLEASITGGRACCALGRIAVDDPADRPVARLLLRPEQVVLTPWAGAAEGARGVVVACDFAGATCTITLDVPAGGAFAAQRLVLRQSGLAAPAIGDTLALGILGAAHVFPDGPPRQAGVCEKGASA
jgi:iron(III) transport system ATP-binding protein